MLKQLLFWYHSIKLGVSTDLLTGAQCVAVFENTFITITPATIKAIPIMAGASSRCLNTTTEIAAVKMMPTPPHMAYATPNGIALSAKEKK